MNTRLSARDTFRAQCLRLARESYRRASTSAYGRDATRCVSERDTRVRGWLCLAILTFLVTAVTFGPSVANERQMRMGHLITLGTASTSGTFWPVGRGLCSRINVYRTETGVRCIAYPTGGSVYNLQAIRSKQLNLAIVRSDLAFKAYNGTGPFESWGPFRELRVVAALYDMPVAVITRRQAEIRSLSDLSGKRLNIGPRGSGQRPLTQLLVAAAGLNLADFRSISELSTSQMGDAFCRGEIDVMVEAIGHPSEFYRRMLDQCDGVVLVISEPDFAKIQSIEPSIRRSSIPAGVYRRYPQPVPTVGFYATLVSAEDVPPETIEAVARSMTTNTASFFGINPNLRPSEIVTINRTGLAIPIHAGAQRLQRFYERLEVEHGQF